MARSSPFLVPEMRQGGTEVKHFRLHNGNERKLQRCGLQEETLAVAASHCYFSTPNIIKKDRLSKQSWRSILKNCGYFFLCVAQYADFPTEGFLHFVPCLVFPAHIAFFAVAISTSLCFSCPENIISHGKKQATPRIVFSPCALHKLWLINFLRRKDFA